MASFTKEVNGRLANRGLTSLVNEATDRRWLSMVLLRKSRFDVDKSARLSSLVVHKPGASGN